MSANSIQASQKLCKAIQAFCSNDYDENMGLLAEDSEILPVINESTLSDLKSFSKLVKLDLEQPESLPKKLQSVIKQVKSLIKKAQTLIF